jgi:large subunit ribosomal protein L23
MPAHVSHTDIIKAPLLTEKTTFGMNELGHYSFIVDRRATKTEIRAAVEAIYKVRVERVNTAVMKSKIRRTKFGLVQDAPVKKAHVTLQGEDKIELF